MNALLSIVQASTFWQQTMPFLAAATTLLLAAIALLFWRQRRAVQRPPQQGLRGDHGGAAAIDYVFTMPIFLLVVLLALQFMMLANASLLVHHAAYNAARAARGVAFERSFLTTVGQSVSPAVANNFFLLWQANRDEAQSRAWDAAAMVLVAAAPGSPNAATGAPRSTAAYNAMPAFYAAAGADQEINDGAMMRKLNYAFDPNNTRVSADLRMDVADLVGGAMGLPNGANQGEWIIQAYVSHLFYMSLPVARYLGEEQPDGSYRWDITATVSLI